MVLKRSVNKKSSTISSTEGAKPETILKQKEATVDNAEGDDQGDYKNYEQSSASDLSKDEMVTLAWCDGDGDKECLTFKCDQDWFSADKEEIQEKKNCSSRRRKQSDDVDSQLVLKKRFPCERVMIEEDVIIPSYAVGVSATFHGERKCSIKNIVHSGFQWAGSPTLRAEKGSNFEFTYWRLSSESKEYYFFAVRNGKELRYVTYKGLGNPFRLDSAGINPALVNLERVHKDPRAFVWIAQRQNNGGILALALDQNQAARMLTSNYNQVIADNVDSHTDTWKIEDKRAGLH